MSVKPEEQLGFVEEIPEFDFELPKLDDMLMSLSRLDTRREGRQLA